MRADETKRKQHLDPLIAELNAQHFEFRLEGPFRNGPAWEYSLWNRDERMLLPGWRLGRVPDAEQGSWEAVYAFLLGVKEAVRWCGPEVWHEVMRDDD